jgi:hypothetical protein
MRQKNGFDQLPKLKSNGIKFEVGDKYLLRQLASRSIRAVRLVHQNPVRDNIMKVVYFLIKGEEEVERLIKSKIRRFKIQPESLILVESRGLLTRI